MKLPKGPKLKLPEKRVPGAVGDVIWDLRERRLLPLVALIVVACVATPFLLGSGSEAPPTTSAAASAAPEAVASGAAKLTVVQAKPGLRDYRKRLADRTPSDPFVQRYSAPVIKNSKLNPEGGGSSEGTVSIGEEESSASPEGSPLPPPSTNPVTSPSSSGGGSGKAPKLTLFAFAAKVSITRSGGKQAGASKKDRSVRNRVLPNTPLPGKKAAVVTYMGPSTNGKNALLLVSAKVKAVFGEIRCVTPSEDICQLVEVQPGFPVTFVYGGNEVHYTFNVIKIEPVITGKL
jgi:hypothetical protein